MPPLRGCDLMNTYTQRLRAALYSDAASRLGQHAQSKKGITLGSALKPRIKSWIGVLILGLSFVAVMTGQAPAGKDLGWAFPTAAMVVNKPPMAEKEFEGQLTIAGTGKSFTMPQLEDLNAPARLVFR